MRPGRPVAPVTLHHFGAGALHRRRDVVAVEEPLEIRLGVPGPDGGWVGVPVSVTMRTPGEDFELAAGFLHGEGVLARRADLARITYCTSPPQEYNVVEVTLRDAASVDLERLRRNVYTTSSCGVCGKASLEAVELQGCRPVARGTLELTAAMVGTLPDALRARQATFERTGGLHAAGLFDRAGEAVSVREDVGRHNAVDKVLGRAFLDDRLPLDRSVLVVSGRTSFEIVQKAVAAGVPALVAVGAPSSLAVDLARRFGVTLVGFARDGGFNVYAGRERLG
ncbi:MAG: formate dehydrogenase accessory sulfurtransferase FdhD [Gemmatimonadetes bacterium]|nr:formate dehydrogenase accessory sulfurtransferase FdhD [Gemmatimonadota bacterium]